MNYIFTGRFQPLHKGHVSFMQQFKNMYPDDLLIICIIRNSSHNGKVENDSNFHRESISKQSKVNNPLPNWERYMLLKTLVENTPSLKNNTVILFRDRSDMDWQTSVADLPTERIFLLPKTVNTPFDVEKKLHYQQIGEQILEIENGEMGVSGTQIRNMLKQKNCDFSFLPECCVDYFKQHCLKYFLED